MANGTKVDSEDEGVAYHPGLADFHEKITKLTETANGLLKLIDKVISKRYDAPQLVHNLRPVSKARYQVSNESSSEIDEEYLDKREYKLQKPKSIAAHKAIIQEESFSSLFTPFTAPASQHQLMQIKKDPVFEKAQSLYEVTLRPTDKTRRFEPKEVNYSVKSENPLEGSTLKVTHDATSNVSIEESLHNLNTVEKHHLPSTPNSFKKLQCSESKLAREEKNLVFEEESEHGCLESSKYFHDSTSNRNVSVEMKQNESIAVGEGLPDTSYTASSSERESELFDYSESDPEFSSSFTFLTTSGRLETGSKNDLTESGGAWQAVFSHPSIRVDEQQSSGSYPLCGAKKKVGSFVRSVSYATVRSMMSIMYDYPMQLLNQRSSKYICNSSHTEKSYSQEASTIDQTSPFSSASSVENNSSLLQKTSISHVKTSSYYFREDPTEKKEDEYIVSKCSIPFRETHNFLEKTNANFKASRRHSERSIYKSDEEIESLYSKVWKESGCESELQECKRGSGCSKDCMNPSSDKSDQNKNMLRSKLSRRKNCVVAAGCTFGKEETSHFNERSPNESTSFDKFTLTFTSSSYLGSTSKVRSVCSQNGSPRSHSSDSVYSTSSYISKGKCASLKPIEKTTYSECSTLFTSSNLIERKHSTFTDQETCSERSFQKSTNFEASMVENTHGRTVYAESHIEESFTSSGIRCRSLHKGKLTLNRSYGAYSRRSTSLIASSLHSKCVHTPPSEGRTITSGTSSYPGDSICAKTGSFKYLDFARIKMKSKNERVLNAHESCTHRKSDITIRDVLRDAVKGLGQNIATTVPSSWTDSSSCSVCKILLSNKCLDYTSSSYKMTTTKAWEEIGGDSKLSSKKSQSTKELPQKYKNTQDNIKNLSKFRLYGARTTSSSAFDLTLSPSESQSLRSCHSLRRFPRSFVIARKICKKCYEDSIPLTKITMGRNNASLNPSGGKSAKNEHKSIAATKVAREIQSMASKAGINEAIYLGDSKTDESFSLITLSTETESDSTRIVRLLCGPVASTATKPKMAHGGSLDSQKVPSYTAIINKPNHGWTMNGRSPLNSASPSVRKAKIASRKIDSIILTASGSKLYGSSPSRRSSNNKLRNMPRDLQKTRKCLGSISKLKKIQTLQSVDGDFPKDCRSEFEVEGCRGNRANLRSACIKPVYATCCSYCAEIGPSYCPDHFYNQASTDYTNKVAISLFERSSKAERVFSATKKLVECVNASNQFCSAELSTENMITQSKTSDDMLTKRNMREIQSSTDNENTSGTKTSQFHTDVNQNIPFRNVCATQECRRKTRTLFRNRKKYHSEYDSDTYVNDDKPFQKGRTRRMFATRRPMKRPRKKEQTGSTTEGESISTSGPPLIPEGTPHLSEELCLCENPLVNGETEEQVPITIGKYPQQATSETIFVHPRLQWGSSISKSWSCLEPSHVSRPLSSKSVSEFSSVEIKPSLPSDFSIAIHPPANSSRYKIKLLEGNSALSSSCYDSLEPSKEDRTTKKPVDIIHTFGKLSLQRVGLDDSFKTEKSDIHIQGIVLSPFHNPMTFPPKLNTLFASACMQNHLCNNEEVGHVRLPAQRELFTQLAMKISKLEQREARTNKKFNFRIKAGASKVSNQKTSLKRTTLPSSTDKDSESSTFVMSVKAKQQIKHKIDFEPNNECPCRTDHNARSYDKKKFVKAKVKNYLVSAPRLPVKASYNFRGRKSSLKRPGSLPMDCNCDKVCGITSNGRSQPVKTKPIAGNSKSITESLTDYDSVAPATDYQTVSSDYDIVHLKPFVEKRNIPVSANDSNCICDNPRDRRRIPPKASSVEKRRKPPIAFPADKTKVLFDKLNNILKRPRVHNISYARGSPPDTDVFSASEQQRGNVHTKQAQEHENLDETMSPQCTCNTNDKVGITALDEKPANAITILQKPRVPFSMPENVRSTQEELVDLKIGRFHAKLPSNENLLQCFCSTCQDKLQCKHPAFECKPMKLPAKPQDLESLLQKPRVNQFDFMQSITKVYTVDHVNIKSVPGRCKCNVCEDRTQCAHPRSTSTPFSPDRKVAEVSAIQQKPRVPHLNSGPAEFSKKNVNVKYETGLDAVSDAQGNAKEKKVKTPICPPPCNCNICQDRKRCLPACKPTIKVNTTLKQRSTEKLLQKPRIFQSKLEDHASKENESIKVKSTPDTMEHEKDFRSCDCTICSDKSKCADPLSSCKAHKHAPVSTKVYNIAATARHPHLMLHPQEVVEKNPTIIKPKTTEKLMPTTNRRNSRQCDCNICRNRSQCRSPNSKCKPMKSKNLGETKAIIENSLLRENEMNAKHSTHCNYNPCEERTSRTNPSSKNHLEPISVLQSPRIPYLTHQTKEDIDKVPIEMKAGRELPKRLIDQEAAYHHPQCNCSICHDRSKCLSPGSSPKQSNNEKLTAKPKHRSELLRKPRVATLIRESTEETDELFIKEKVHAKPSKLPITYAAQERPSHSEQCNCSICQHRSRCRSPDPSSPPTKIQGMMVKPEDCRNFSQKLTAPQATQKPKEKLEKVRIEMKSYTEPILPPKVPVVQHSQSGPHCNCTICEDRTKCLSPTSSRRIMKTEKPVTKQEIGSELLRKPRVPVSDFEEYINGKSEPTQVKAAVSPEKSSRDETNPTETKPYKPRAAEANEPKTDGEHSTDCVCQRCEDEKIRKDSLSKKPIDVTGMLRKPRVPHSTSESQGRTESLPIETKLNKEQIKLPIVPVVQETGRNNPQCSCTICEDRSKCVSPDSSCKPMKTEKPMTKQEVGSELLRKPRVPTSDFEEYISGKSEPTQVKAVGGAERSLPEETYPTKMKPYVPKAVAQANRPQSSREHSTDCVCQRCENEKTPREALSKKSIDITGVLRKPRVPHSRSETEGRPDSIPIETKLHKEQFKLPIVPVVQETPPHDPQCNCTMCEDRSKCVSPDSSCKPMKTEKPMTKQEVGSELLRKPRVPTSDFEEYISGKSEPTEVKASVVPERSSREETSPTESKSYKSKAAEANEPKTDREHSTDCVCQRCEDEKTSRDTLSKKPIAVTEMLRKPRVPVSDFEEYISGKSEPTQVKAVVGPEKSSREETNPTETKPYKPRAAEANEPKTDGEHSTDCVCQRCEDEKIRKDSLSKKPIDVTGMLRKPRVPHSTSESQGRTESLPIEMKLDKEPTKLPIIPVVQETERNNPQCSCTICKDGSKCVSPDSSCKPMKTENPMTKQEVGSELLRKPRIPTSDFEEYISGKSEPTEVKASVVPERSSREETSPTETKSYKSKAAEANEPKTDREHSTDCVCQRCENEKIPRDPLSKKPIDVTGTLRKPRVPHSTSEPEGRTESIPIDTKIPRVPASDLQESISGKSEPTEVKAIVGSERSLPEETYPTEVKPNVPKAVAEANRPLRSREHSTDCVCQRCEDEETSRDALSKKPIAVTEMLRKPRVPVSDFEEYISGKSEPTQVKAVVSPGRSSREETSPTETKPYKPKRCEDEKTPRDALSKKPIDITEVLRKPRVPYSTIETEERPDSIPIETKLHKEQSKLPIVPVVQETPPHDPQCDCTMCEDRSKCVSPDSSCKPLKTEKPMTKQEVGSELLRKPRVPTSDFEEYISGKSEPTEVKATVVPERSSREETSPTETKSYKLKAAEANEPKTDREHSTDCVCQRCENEKIPRDPLSKKPIDVTGTLRKPRVPHSTSEPEGRAESFPVDMKIPRVPASDLQEYISGKSEPTEVKAIVGSERSLPEETYPTEMKPNVPKAVAEANRPLRSREHSTDCVCQRCEDEKTPRDAISKKPIAVTEVLRKPRVPVSDFEEYISGKSEPTQVKAVVGPEKSSREETNPTETKPYKPRAAEANEPKADREHSTDCVCQRCEDEKIRKDSLSKKPIDVTGMLRKPRVPHSTSEPQGRTESLPIETKLDKEQTKLPLVPVVQETGRNNPQCSCTICEDRSKCVSPDSSCKPLKTEKPMTKQEVGSELLRKPRVPASDFEEYISGKSEPTEVKASVVPERSSREETSPTETKSYKSKAAEANEPKTDREHSTDCVCQRCENEKIPRDPLSKKPIDVTGTLRKPRVPHSTSEPEGRTESIPIDTKIPRVPASDLQESISGKSEPTEVKAIVGSETSLPEETYPTEVKPNVPKAVAEANRPLRSREHSTDCVCQRCEDEKTSRDALSKKPIAVTEMLRKPRVPVSDFEEYISGKSEPTQVKAVVSPGRSSREETSPTETKPYKPKVTEANESESNREHNADCVCQRCEDEKTPRDALSKKPIDITEVLRKPRVPHSTIETEERPDSIPIETKLHKEQSKLPIVPVVQETPPHDPQCDCTMCEDRSKCVSPDSSCKPLKTEKPMTKQEVGSELLRKPRVPASDFEEYISGKSEPTEVKASVVPERSSRQETSPTETKSYKLKAAEANEPKTDREHSTDCVCQRCENEKIPRDPLSKKPIDVTGTLRKPRVPHSTSEPEGRAESIPVDTKIPRVTASDLQEYISGKSEPTEVKAIVGSERSLPEETYPTEVKPNVPKAVAEANRPLRSREHSTDCVCQRCEDEKTPRDAISKKPIAVTEVLRKPRVPVSDFEEYISGKSEPTQVKAVVGPGRSSREETYPTETKPYKRKVAEANESESNREHNADCVCQRCEDEKTPRDALSKKPIDITEVLRKPRVPHSTNETEERPDSIPIETKLHKEQSKLPIVPVVQETPPHDPQCDCTMCEDRSKCVSPDSSCKPLKTEKPMTKQEVGSELLRKPRVPVSDFEEYISGKSEPTQVKAVVGPERSSREETNPTETKPYKPKAAEANEPKTDREHSTDCVCQRCEDEKIRKDSLSKKPVDVTGMLRKPRVPHSTSESQGRTESLPIETKLDKEQTKLPIVPVVQETGRNNPQCSCTICEDRSKCVSPDSSCKPMKTEKPMTKQEVGSELLRKPRVPTSDFEEYISGKSEPTEVKASVVPKRSSREETYPTEWKPYKRKVTEANESESYREHNADCVCQRCEDEKTPRDALTKKPIDRTGVLRKPRVPHSTSESVGRTETIPIEMKLHKEQSKLPIVPVVQETQPHKPQCNCTICEDRSKCISPDSSCKPVKTEKPMTKQQVGSELLRKPRVLASDFEEYISGKSEPTEVKTIVGAERSLPEETCPTETKPYVPKAVAEANRPHRSREHSTNCVCQRCEDEKIPRDELSEKPIDVTGMLQKPRVPHSTDLLEEEEVDVPIKTKVDTKPLEHSAVQIVQEESSHLRPCACTICQDRQKCISPNSSCKPVRTEKSAIKPGDIGRLLQKPRVAVSDNGGDISGRKHLIESNATINPVSRPQETQLIEIKSYDSRKGTGRHSGDCQCNACVDKINLKNALSKKPFVINLMLQGPRIPPLVNTIDDRLEVSVEVKPDKEPQMLVMQKKIISYPQCNCNVCQNKSKCHLPDLACKAMKTEKITIKPESVRELLAKPKVHVSDFGGNDTGKSKPIKLKTTIDQRKDPPVETHSMLESEERIEEVPIEMKPHTQPSKLSTPHLGQERFSHLAHCHCSICQDRAKCLSPNSCKQIKSENVTIKADGLRDILQKSRIPVSDLAEEILAKKESIELKPFTDYGKYPASDHTPIEIKLNESNTAIVREQETGRKHSTNCNCNLCNGKKESSGISSVGPMTTVKVLQKPRDPKSATEKVIPVETKATVRYPLVPKVEEELVEIRPCELKASNMLDLAFPCETTKYGSLNTHDVNVSLAELSTNRDEPKHLETQIVPVQAKQHAGKSVSREGRLSHERVNIKPQVRDVRISTALMKEEGSHKTEIASTSQIIAHRSHCKCNMCKTAKLHRYTIKPYDIKTLLQKPRIPQTYLEPNFIGQNNQTKVATVSNQEDDTHLETKPLQMKPHEKCSKTSIESQEKETHSSDCNCDIYEKENPHPSEALHKPIVRKTPPWPKEVYSIEVKPSSERVTNKAFPTSEKPSDISRLFQRPKISLASLQPEEASSAAVVSHMLQCKCEVCLKRSIKTEKIQLKAFDRKEPGILSKSKVQLKEDECEPPAAISKEQRELPPLVSQPTQTVQLPVKQKPTILPSRREPDIDVSVPTIGQAISVELKPNNARDLSPSLPSRHFANPVVLKTTRGEKARTSPCRVLQQSNESRKVSSDRELPSVQYPIRIHQTPKKDKKAEISTPLQSAPLQFGETCRCEQCESSNLRQTSPIKVKSQVGEHIFQKPRIPSPTFTDYTGKVEQPLGVTGDVHECTCEICQEGGTKECPSKYKRFTCFHCCKRKQKSVISCHRRPSKTKLERMSDPIDSIKPSSSSKIDKVETTSLHTIFPPVSPKASTRSIHSSMITSCPCLYSLESSEKDESQVCTCKSELSLIGKISEETEKPEETLGSQIPSRSVARISQGSLLSCVTSCSCWRVQDDETFSSKSTSEIESFISVKSSREFEEVTEGERIPCTCKTKPPPATQEVIPIESEEQLHEESESISVEPAFSRLTTSQLSAAKSMRSLFGTSSAQISIPINDRHPEESISSNLGKSYEDISLPEKSCSCTVCQLTPGQPLIHENLEQDYHDSPGSKSETCRTTTIDIPSRPLRCPNKCGCLDCPFLNPDRKSKTQFTYKCPQYRNHGDDVECQERRRRDIIDQRTKRCAICRRLLMDSGKQ
ncbi:unnamed protein product [Hermetia illucens]|uniref:Uncharacterized protein n=1 Tax=Hermetia illucens TaxID=343691 RepID=A0A7R8Z0Q1_HERIL|nr:unnamed protein product [Hermetia illucens]